MKWRWTKEEESAFKAAKELLLSSQVLAHYNPELELILSSAYGSRDITDHARRVRETNWIRIEVVVAC